MAAATVVYPGSTRSRLHKYNEQTTPADAAPAGRRFFFARMVSNSEGKGGAQD